MELIRSFSKKWCDVDNVKNFAFQLTDNLKHDSEKIKKIFYFVRDEIKYKFDKWDVRASETLKKRAGMCANKSNLQVALLRALGITSAYGIIWIKKECLKPIIERNIFDRVKSKIIHCFCYVRESNRWLPFDTTIDRELWEKVYKENGWSIEPGGEGVIHIPRELWITKPELRWDIDEILETPSELITDDVLKIMNNYLLNLRT